MLESDYDKTISHADSLHGVQNIPYNSLSSQVTVFPRRHFKLDYSKYLVGRSYLIFKSGARTTESLKFNRKKLYYFCEYLDLTTEDIVSKYGRLTKSRDGKREPNVEGQIEFQKKVEDYVLMLQEKVSEGRIKPTTCVSMLPPVKLFCEMNDILLNWKIINRMLPRYDTNATDEAYTREQIKKMLEYCDLRTKGYSIVSCIRGI
jgi:hypothetical protein